MKPTLAVHRKRSKTAAAVCTCYSLLTGWLDLTTNGCILQVHA